MIFQPPPPTKLHRERLSSLGLFAFLPSPQNFCPQPCQVCDHTLLIWAHAAWADKPGPRGPGERRKGCSVDGRPSHLQVPQPHVQRDSGWGYQELSFPRKENVAVIWVGKRPSGGFAPVQGPRSPFPRLQSSFCKASRAKILKIFRQRSYSSNLRWKPNIKLIQIRSG